MARFKQRRLRAPTPPRPTPTLPLKGEGDGRTLPMPDLLLELFSEEIPARMQRRAAEDLQKLVTDALVERGFVYEGAKAFATPRRLALNIVGLPVKGAGRSGGTQRAAGRRARRRRSGLPQERRTGLAR